MACIRRVEELSTDPDFVGYYDLEEAHKQDLSDSYETGYDDGMNKGKEAGKIEGKKEEKLEIAKVMLSKNICVKDISDITGLSIEEIEKLQ